MMNAEITKETLDAARLQLEYLNTQRELNHAQLAIREREQESVAMLEAINTVPSLQESIYYGPDGNGFVDQRAIYSNIPGMEGFGDIDRPTQPDDSQHGDFAPFWRSLPEHRSLQGLNRFLATAHDHGATLVDRLVDYTIHTGNEYTAEARKPEKPSDALLAEVNLAIDEILDDNDWQCFGEGEALAMLHSQGELRIHVGEEAGQVRMDVVLPEHIQEPHVDDIPLVARELKRKKGYRLEGACWRYGVITPATKTQLPLGYFYQPEQSGRNWEFWTTDEVVEVKLNVPQRVKRGMSDFYPVARLMKDLAPLMSNLAIMAAIQASIALIETNDDKKGGGVTPGGFTGQKAGRFFGNDHVVNDPGQIVTQKGTKLERGPVGDNQAESLLSVLNAGYRLVGNRWAFPEYASTANAENNNRASSETAETPLVRSTERKQKRLTLAAKRAIWMGLAIHAKRGRFRKQGIGSVEELKKVVRINVQPPEVSTKDIGAETDRYSTMVQGKSMSRQTWAEKTGLDWEEEQERMAAEHEEAMAQQEEMMKMAAANQPGEDEDPDGSANGGGGNKPKGGGPNGIKPSGRLQRAAEMIWDGYPIGGAMGRRLLESAKKGGTRSGCGAGEPGDPGFKKGNDCAAGDGGSDGGWSATSDGAKWEKAAIEEFGLTDDPHEAGYVLRNGKMLDFSGKNDGGQPGQRSYDHRQIETVTDGLSRTKAMLGFMGQSGAMRHSHMGDSAFVDVSAPLSPAQVRVVSGYLRDGVPTEYDINSLEGDTLFSGEVTSGRELSTFKSLAELAAGKKTETQWAIDDLRNLARNEGLIEHDARPERFEARTKIQEAKSGKKPDCGANAPGGGGFQPGNTCAQADKGDGGGGGHHDASEPESLRQAAAGLQSLIASQGGFTYQPITENGPEAGYAVSPFPEAELAISVDEITEETVFQYLKKYAEKFDDERVHVGGWIDTETDIVYLDLSIVVESKEEAILIANQHGQEGIFDLERAETIIVKTDKDRRRTVEATRQDGCGSSQDGQGHCQLR